MRPHISATASTSVAGTLADSVLMSHLAAIAVTCYDSRVCSTSMMHHHSGVMIHTMKQKEKGASIHCDFLHDYSAEDDTFLCKIWMGVSTDPSSTNTEKAVWTRISKLYNASSASPRYTENLLSKLSWFPLAPFRIGVCRSEKSLEARWRHITEDVNKFNECYVQTQEVCTLIVCL